MNLKELKIIWKKEENAAHIHGWDFSHISPEYGKSPIFRGDMRKSKIYHGITSPLSDAI